MRVVRAVDHYLEGLSREGIGSIGEWTKRTEEVRRSCARLIGSDTDEIAFIKNTSHGLSLVANGLDWREGDNLIVYEREFPSNIYPWLALQKRGVETRCIPFTDGTIALDAVEERIDSRTRLISMSSVQFQNGFRMDIEQLGALCKDKGLYFCVDAIQSLGIIPMDVKKYHIDFLSADGHKWLLSPEGTGLFYCKKELVDRLMPPLIGWKSVINDNDFENIDFILKKNALRFEEASMNIMGVQALGAALDLLFEVGIDRVFGHVLAMGQTVIERAEGMGLAILSPRNIDARGGIVTIGGDFDPHTVKEHLQKKKIIVNVRGGGLRLSPHFYNTEHGMENLFSHLKKLMQGRWK